MIQPQAKPGLSCPRCKTHIETSIQHILSGRIQCPRCYLVLNVDKQASQEALSALQKVQDAEEKLRKASRFER